MGRPGWRKRAARRGTSLAEAAALGLLAALVLRAMGLPVALPGLPAQAAPEKPAPPPRRDLGVADVVNETKPEAPE